MAEFIISDESIVNREKFRVLTGTGEGDGIVITGYENNMPVYHNHDWVIGKMAIGQTEKLVKKKGELIATPRFDEKDIDPETKRVIKKIKDGFIKGASVGIDVLKWSEDPKDMLEGQQRPTVIQSDLLEWSVTGIPINKGAVSLSCKKQGIMLSANVDKAYLNILLPIVEKHPEKMKEICLRLGLPVDADEKTIIAAIEALNKKSVDMLLSMGKTSGIVTDANEATFRALATKDYDNTFALLQVKATAPTTVAPTTTTTTESTTQAAAEGGQDQTLAGAITALSKQLKGQNDDKSPKESLADQYLTLSKKDPTVLSRMQKDEPDRYKLMEEAYIKSLA